jgi:hypothetical protein
MSNQFRKQPRHTHETSAHISQANVPNFSQQFNKSPSIFEKKYRGSHKISNVKTPAHGKKNFRPSYQHVRQPDFNTQSVPQNNNTPISVVAPHQFHSNNQAAAAMVEPFKSGHQQPQSMYNHQFDPSEFNLNSNNMTPL